jgi:hypothetical protein
MYPGEHVLPSLRKHQRSMLISDAGPSSYACNCILSEDIYCSASLYVCTVCTAYIILARTHPPCPRLLLLIFEFRTASNLYYFEMFLLGFQAELLFRRVGLIVGSPSYTALSLVRYVGWFLQERKFTTSNQKFFDRREDIHQRTRKLAAYAWVITS